MKARSCLYIVAAIMVVLGISVFFAFKKGLTEKFRGGGGGGYGGQALHYGGGGTAGGQESGASIVESIVESKPCSTNMDCDGHACGPAGFCM